MEKGKGSLTRKLLNIILIGMVAFSFYYGLANITYANINSNEPNVIITIAKDGRMACNGSFLGRELWYPGKKESGVIRIINNYRNVVLKNIELTVILNSSKPGVDRDIVFASFLNNMNLTLKRGRPLVFNETLYYERAFMYLANGLNDADQNGQMDSLNIRIPSGGFTDFKYIVSMNKEAGDELEELNASVDISLDLQEDVIETENS